MKDAIASYQVLIELFERIQLFLQRLKNYTAVQLTPDLTDFLGKLLAQVLCILALSTKVMKERRISGYICSKHSAIADYDTEQFMKRVVGRTDVKDALQRLDTLTQEDNLMTKPTTFEVSRQVHEAAMEIKEVVRGVGDDVRAAREIASYVNRNVLEIKEVPYDAVDGVNRVRKDVRNVNDNVVGARQRALRSDNASLVVAETRTQGTSHKRSFENG